MAENVNAIKAKQNQNLRAAMLLIVCIYVCVGDRDEGRNVEVGERLFIEGEESKKPNLEEGFPLEIQSEENYTCLY